MGLRASHGIQASLWTWHHDEGYDIYHFHTILLAKASPVDKPGVNGAKSCNPFTGRAVNNREPYTTYHNNYDHKLSLLYLVQSWGLQNQGQKPQERLQKK